MASYSSRIPRKDIFYGHTNIFCEFFNILPPIFHLNALQNRTRLSDVLGATQASTDLAKKIAFSEIDSSFSLNYLIKNQSYTSSCH